MTDSPDRIRSTIGGMAWPALPDAAGALALAVQFQLEQSQWWPQPELEQHQMRQLRLLLQHAHDSLPFWRERLAAAGFRPGMEPTPTWLSTLPLLTRDDVQRQGEALLSRSVPPQHGRIVKDETSGSTGKPITHYGTELTQFFWRAHTLRDHLWHDRDFSGTLAAIRSGAENARQDGWGPATDAAFYTGACATLPIKTPMAEQLAWLGEVNPDYLLSYPSNIQELALLCKSGAIPLPRLREVRSMGETVSAELRALCVEALGAPLVDMYTSQETGYIALQCPEHAHYHVQSENLVVEILGDDGRSCAPGQIGRVVVTTLHNFAMPLIRYWLGDYAEAGAPCPCGRGLPVIRQILGRQRNMLTLPDGRRHWASFRSEIWSPVAPVRQLQLTQKSREWIVARVVAGREFTPQETRDFIAALQECLGHSFRITIERVAEIPRSASYKFEDFVSEISG